MNYTPAQPAYEDMRRDAFARFGIGQGADGGVTCFLGIVCTPPQITESFAKPAFCP